MHSSRNIYFYFPYLWKAVVFDSNVFLLEQYNTYNETGLILKCAGKAGNPFQTTQGTWRSGLVRWDHTEGWDREGGGRGVQDGDTCTLMGDSCRCMAKTTTML